ncbi:hypothetical protein K523DRAFT_355846 [Schizophyllum commune Tattone D]|nr:hypothetical protein K523DRAFT_355846 [Schizophyllum commune Tattone D]
MPPRICSTLTCVRRTQISANGKRRSVRMAEVLKKVHDDHLPLAVWKNRRTRRLNEPRDGQGARRRKCAMPMRKYSVSKSTCTCLSL